MSFRQLRSSLLLLGFALASCNGSRGAAPLASGAKSAALAPSAAPTSSAASGREVTPRVKELLSAEQRRASRDVRAEDLTSRDVRVRRAAARALSRIADEHSAELLGASLADEDPEVVAWSAYGLGTTCEGREPAHTRALVARATSWLARENAVEKPPPLGVTLLTPSGAIADALGRCGGAEAERTLRAWLELDASLAKAAAWALGTLASKRDHLEDATLVALLDVAARPQGAVPSALQAFTRLTTLDAAAQSRLFEVARPKLVRPGPERPLAIRALAAAGERAAVALGEVLVSNAAAAERADAARALARLGATGQRALSEALVILVKDATTTNPEGLLSAKYGVLTAVLGALTPPPDRAGPALSLLATLSVGKTPGLERRSVALRCAAASLLAGRGIQSAPLAACDPNPNGRIGRLARLAVLARGPLAGSRGQSWRALAAADDPLVRERALELLADHPEATGTSEPIARALGAKTAGEVATAARLLADHPERAAASGAGDHAGLEVTRALGQALETWDASPNIEVRTNLADAAGALALLGEKPRLEAACTSPNPTLRLHAEKALRLLGDRARKCDHFEPPRAPPPELSSVPNGLVQLDIETDTGIYQLELDPTLAPVAVARIVELARSGFYLGVTVHRVVPGFVVQLGDPDGDGYGGAPRPALSCETSPARFESGSVGIALSGRDTGSSQFFVTLGREAHLDGEYALIGRAGPNWDRVVPGDVIRAVRVR